MRPAALDSGIADAARSGHRVDADVSPGSRPVPREPRTLHPGFASLAFAALALFFFAPGILFGQIPIARDLLVWFIPLRMSSAGAVFGGELPLWTRDQFFGAPFLANNQSALFYPPVTILLALPGPVGFSLFLAIHVFLAGWGLCRYLRIVERFDSASAVFGGTVFAFGGFLVSIITFSNHLAAAAWSPWALLAAARLQASGASRYFLALAAVLTCQALVGAAETVILTGVVVVADLARRSASPRRAGKCVLAAGAAALLAALTAAVQLLPTLEYLGTSERMDAFSLEHAAAESLEPVSLVQLALPHTFEEGAPGFIPESGVPLYWSIYLGAASLVFLAAGLSRASWLWPVLGATGLLLSLGAHTPAFPALHALVPGGMFRFPGKLFLLAHLALSILAAAGFRGTLIEGKALARSIGAALALAVTGVAIVAAVHVDPHATLDGFGYHLRPDLSPEASAYIGAQLGRKAWRLVAVSLATGLLLVAARRGAVRSGLAAALVIIVTLVDLVTVHRPMLVFTDWAELRESTGAERFGARPGDRLFHYCLGCLPAGAPGLGAWRGSARIGENAEWRGRVMWRAMVPNVPMIYGLGTTTGNDAITTRDQGAYYRVIAGLPRPEGIRVLAALGVSWLIGEEPLEAPGLEHRTGLGDGLFVHAVSQAAPRTYLAQRIGSAPNVTEALVRLASPAFRPGQDVVLEAPEPPAGLTAAIGRIESVSFTRHAVEAVLELEQGGLWVVGDTWYPGWEATIDGEPAVIRRANGFHRALLVPAGRHHVVQRYRPSSFRAGAALSLVGLAVFALLGLRSRLAGSSRPATPWRGASLPSPAARVRRVAAGSRAYLIRRRRRRRSTSG